MSKLRLLIVDDERPARALIRKFLENEPEVEIVGEAATGRDAVELIHNTSPDLVFLDIQMPEMNGFQVLKSRTSRMPHVVFVTAYDQYALRAFEVHALDYLLKPFNRQRFMAALEHAKNQIRTEKTIVITDRIERLIDELESRSKCTERLAVDHQGRKLFIPAGEIDWIEAAEKYVQLHAGDRCYLLRESMRTMEENLDPRKFIRIHRSTIVNMSRIKEIQPWFHGRYVIVLNNGTRLTSGKKYRERVIQLFQNFS